MKKYFKIEPPPSSSSGIEMKFPDDFPDSGVPRTVRTQMIITPGPLKALPQYGLPPMKCEYNGIIPRPDLDMNLGPKKFKLRSFYARAYQRCFMEGTRPHFETEFSNLRDIMNRIRHGERVKKNEYMDSLSRVEVLTMLEMQLASDALEQHLKSLYFLENFEKGQWKKGSEETIKKTMRHDYFQMYESLSKETKNDLRNAWENTDIRKGEPERPDGMIMEGGALQMNVFITFPNNKEAIYRVLFDERTGFVKLAFDHRFVRHREDDVGPGECTIPIQRIPPHYYIADEKFSKRQVQESLDNVEKRIKRYLPLSNFEKTLKFLSEKEGVALWNIRYASENVTSCKPRVLFFDLSVVNDFFNQVQSVLAKKTLEKDRAEGI